MSHQTGIEADKELEGYFSRCRDKDVRTMAVQIENEALTHHSSCGALGTMEEDFSNQVQRLLEDKTPRFILFRLGSSSKRQDSEEWLLLLWSPEDSSIRDKMLYASTKATLKRQFGTTRVREEMFASSREEATLGALQKHLVAAKAPAPLTMREEEMLEVKRMEVRPDVGIDTKHQTLTGISFPMTKEAMKCLGAFASGSLQYACFRIELSREEIELDKDKKSLKVEKLPDYVPETTARYHLYRYPHSHEGDQLKSVVFIYSMPGSACSIKERMMYSSSKLSFINNIEGAYSIAIDKKVEIGEGSELTEEFLLSELHPQACLHKPKFSKPKGPANRGQKRITRPQAANE